MPSLPRFLVPLTKPHPALLFIPVAAATYCAAGLIVGNAAAEAHPSPDSTALATTNGARHGAESSKAASVSAYALPEKLPATLPTSVFAVAPAAAPVFTPAPAAVVSGSSGSSGGGGDSGSSAGSGTSPGNHKSAPTPNALNGPATNHMYHNAQAHAVTPHTYAYNAPTTPRSYAPAPPRVAVNQPPQRYAPVAQPAPRVVVVPRFNLFRPFFNNTGNRFNFAGGGRHR